ncbi:hypothetical protein MTO96_004319 [Rhipicephalus appendiculatus]|uniref:Juvenile hormone esterase binding protein n=1 Tax=Rhipicephalus appendiculatus TaxID=34631 RepID=A0A131Z414_RHIAP
MAALRQVAFNLCFRRQNFVKLYAGATAACVRCAGLSYQCSRTSQVRPLSSPVCADKTLQRYSAPALCAQSVRRCSSRSENNFNLMKNPNIVWPNFIFTIKNWIQTIFIIKPYLDATFNQREFLDGAKQAMTYVSVLMANGDFKSMEGLVTNDVAAAAQAKCGSLSVEQRQRLGVKLSDIYFCFLYQIGIIMDDNSNQRYVEATVVYHYMPGLEEVRRNPEMVEHLQDKIHVANYRFIRDYTKGAESDWTINQLNHFKMAAVP